MAGIRVYKLAEELTVETRDVLAAFAAIPDAPHITSAGAELTDQVADLVRSHIRHRQEEHRLAREKTAAEKQQAELRQLRERAEADAARRRERAAHNDPFEAALRREPIPRTQSQPTYPSRPRYISTEVEREAQRFVEELSGRKVRPPRGRGGRRGHHSGAPAKPPANSWDRAFVDPSEKREWMSAGLGPDDYEIARAWAAAGMTIEDLRMTLAVDGVTAADRLRGRGPGSVEPVVKRIKDIKSA